MSLGLCVRQLCVLSSAARALLSNELSESCALLEADGTYPPMTWTSTKLLRDALKKVVDAGAAFPPPVEHRSCSWKMRPRLWHPRVWR